MTETKQHLYGDLREILDDDLMHEVAVHKMMTMAHHLHNAKEEIYNRSFARRGLVGIFMNIARKFDNVETFVMKEEYKDFHLVDALFDIAIYSFKMIDTIRRLHPEAYNEWVENVYKKFVKDSEDAS